MNIGQTGLYFDERWLFLLILASLGYFYCLVKCYRRNISAAPRKRVLFFVVFWIISICGVFGLILAFHDLAFAGQNYNRESDFKCMDTLPPKSNVRNVLFSNQVLISRQKTRAFVLAKYKENTTWVQCPEWRDVSYYVYEKSNIKREDTENHIFLENVGYECPAYMRYIIDHYDQLPDQVFFVHGNPFEHCGGFGDAVTALENDSFYIFSIWNWRFSRSGWPHYWPHQGFASVMDRVYGELFGTAPPDKLQTYFNGQFMASRDAILQHPREFYKKILELTTTRRDRNAYSWGSTGDGWMEVSANFSLISEILTVHVVLRDGKIVAKSVHRNGRVHDVLSRTHILLAFCIDRG